MSLAGHEYAPEALQLSMTILYPNEWKIFADSDAKHVLETPRENNEAALFSKAVFKRNVPF